MTWKHFRVQAVDCLRAGAALLAVWQMSVGSAMCAQDTAEPQTVTPIKHVILIIGENRTFDHIFATYVPPKGETVNNLLSEGIINADGAPGPNYSLAAQYSADVTNSPDYQPSPSNKSLYSTLPAPLAGGPSNVCTNNGVCTLEEAESSEDGLPIEFYPFMLSGGTGLTNGTPDSRITGVSQSAPYSTLMPGPFQLTNTYTSDLFPYDSYAQSPVHRFYQMWQEEDCSVAHATSDNPAGCLHDLFPWVETTIGAGNNGAPQPGNFSTTYAPGTVGTGEGSTSMGFYNVQNGDAPYLTYLAQTYAMSDNYHQAVMGGTGANHIMLGFADAIYFEDSSFNAAVPPENALTFLGGPVNEIENPNPQAGTNNWYTEDGYGAFGDSGSSTGVYGGGSYSSCADVTQPGVGPIVSYLSGLTTPINANCQANHYYLLNNYNPGYFGDGTNAFTNTNSSNTPFTIPPTNQRMLANLLDEHKITWAYFGDQWNEYLTDPYQLDYGVVGPASDQYCNICNPYQYSSYVMTNPTDLANLQDTENLYSDIAAGTLPAVSYVKPSGWVDGHPASSKIDLFEGFVQKIVDAVESNPALAANTVIFITFDEGGGYYDSGYVQPLDFFGDGTRIPLLAVSKYTKPGHISHVYSDHVSVVKFIEHNWKLKPITGRSRDNYPIPTAGPTPYVPGNSPALGDLFDLFDFSK
ncbi:MAG: alkaline phosphatase family protein [Bryobacteraceae bacterium]|jgi:phospholipase C